MQSETHNPKHFLENVYKADFGKGGTLKFTCKGIVGRSNTLPNQIRQGEPSGGQPKRPLSLIDQDTSCDCPGALFSWCWSWSSPRHCRGSACFPARQNHSRCCCSSPTHPWDSLCFQRPHRFLPCRSLSAPRRPWSRCCPSVSSRCPVSPAASSGVAALAEAGLFGEWLFCHNLQVSLCAIWLLLINSV